MAITAEILTRLTADASQFKAEIASASATMQSSSSGIDKFAAVGKAAFLTLGTAAVVFGAVSVKAALDYEAAHARLVTAIKNSGSTWDAQAAAVEHVDSNMRNLGFTDTDTESSLAKLTTATHDTTKAQDLMSLAADIARGRHIDLASATDILAKVETGRVGLLGRLGINTKDVTGATITQEEAIKRLSALYGGQAQAYTDTFAGKLDVLRAQFEHIATTVGEALIPILTGLMSALSDVVSFLENNQAAAIALGVAIASVLVPALTAAAISMAETAAAFVLDQWAAAVGVIMDIVAAFQLLAEGATLAEVASLGLAGAFAAVALPVTIVVGAVAAVYGAVQGLEALFGDTTKSLKDFADEGTNLGNSFVKTTEANNTLADATAHLAAQSDSLKTNIKELTFEHENLYSNLAHGTDQYRQSNTALQASQALYAQQTQELAKNHAELDVVNKALEENRQKLEQQRLANQQATAEAAAAAKTWGVELPAGLQLTDKAAQQLSSSIETATVKFGAGSTAAIQMLVNLGQGADVLKDTISHFDTLTTSVGNFTNVATAFKGPLVDAFGVTEKAMNDFLVNTNAKAQTWLNDLSTLIKAGVDQGIVGEFEKAGPQSEPALEALNQLVKDKGAEYVNSLTSATRQATLNAAINAAEMDAVVKAYLEDMASGGTASLRALAQHGDENMKALVFSALSQLPQVAGAINSIPSYHPVDIPINVTNLPLIYQAQQAVQALTGQTWSVNIVTHVGQLPMTPLQAAQAAGAIP